MRSSHYEFGGAILSKRAKDDRANRASRILASTSDIAFRLSSVTATPYSLVWEAFAETRANPNSEAVGEFLKRFGVDKPWEKISLKAGSSTLTLKTRLDNFLLLRHECAHSGMSTTIPTPSEIRDICILLDKIAGAIVDVLEDHVQTI
jgi:hypothetical protein